MVMKMEYVGRGLERGRGDGSTIRVRLLISFLHIKITQENRRHEQEKFEDKTLIVAHRHNFCLQNHVARQQCKPCLSDIYYMHTVYTCKHQHSQYTCKTYLVISVCPYLQCIYNQLIVLDSICVYSGLIYNEFTISILIDNIYNGN